MNSEQTITLTVSEQNQTTLEPQNYRLDRWLSESLETLSRSRIQTLISQGHVTVNQKVCVSKKLTLKRGDHIEVKIPPNEPLELEAVDIPLDILYEDEHLIIINKQAGLVVHPSAGHVNDTLVNALLAHCDTLAGIGGVERPGIVHRLDKDTTGAIVVAKTDFSLQSLQQQIKNKTAQRQYLGVVYGSHKADFGTIEQPIGRHLADRKKMAVVTIERGGRNAITHWQIQERLGNYSLILFTLETGRTHQIRVHSNFIGHPIVGDLDYSSGRSVGVNLSGQALHAWKLKLQHPVTEEWIEAIAPLPEEMNTLLQVLRRRLG